MVLFSRIPEKTHSHLSSRTLSRSGLGVRVVFAFVLVAFSLSGLARGEVLSPLALLLLAGGLLLDTAAVLSYASRPTLAVASYLTSITAQILGVVLLALYVFSRQ